VEWTGWRGRCVLIWWGDAVDAAVKSAGASCEDGGLAWAGGGSLELTVAECGGI